MLKNLHFLAVQQHAVDFLDGVTSSFFSFKMDKAIAARTIFITDNLQQIIMQV